MSGAPQLADGARYAEAPDALDIAIADGDASTIIRLRGTGGCARIADVGCIFDKLGVEVVSCSTTASARSCDLTLLVVDRHDSQPLDDCMKRNVKEGLHTVLQNGSAAPTACAGIPDMGAAEQQAASGSPPQRNSSTDSRSELLGVSSAAMAVQQASACSRQPSFGESLQDKQLLHALEQQPDDFLSEEAKSSSNTDDRGEVMSLGSRRNSIRFALPLIPVAEEVASPAVVPGSTLRPQLTIDIPSTADAGLLSNGSFFISGSTVASSQLSDRVTPTAFAGFDIVKRPGDPSHSSRYAAPNKQQQQQPQQQQSLAAQELTERLMQLGLGRSTSKPLADDSSNSEDEADVVISSVTSSRRPSNRWLGPLSRQQSSGVVNLMPPSSSSHDGKGRSQRSSTDHGGDSAGWCSMSATAQQAATAAALAAAWSPEPSAQRDSLLHPSAGAPLSPVITEKARATALLSPCVSKPPASARRWPPPRTPSRIVLSPVAPDGFGNCQRQPKLFVSIPKQSVDEKRTRKPVGRTPSNRQVVAATPRQMLQQLAVHDSTDRFSCAVTSPTAAAADAASKMPFNVAAAAAQLLGKNRDAAAAAIATAVAGDTSPLMQSPVHTASSSAANSADLLPSPPTATPKGVSLTPATPVHPVVAAIAAVAFRAAAEAVGEAKAAEAAAASAVIEEDEEGLSVASSVDEGAGAVAFDESPGSSSEEWWCGSLTGMVVKDVMTAPLEVVHQNTDVLTARQLMVKHNLPGMLVDTGMEPPGFLTRRDFIKASITQRAHKRKQPKLCVKDIMSKPVIAVDASQPIEMCAQMMQEQGITRVAVRDADAADPANPIAAYIGLVSDTTIFKFLGLYPDEGADLDDDLASLVLPSTSRQGATSNSSAGGSAFDTPFSSRPPTPLVPAKSSARSDLCQQVLCAQQRQQQPSTAGSEGVAPANISHTADLSRRTPASGLSPAASLGSAGAAVALDRSSSSSSAAEAKAGEQPVAGGSIGSTAAGSDSSTAAPDALLRYRTAASLWEVDVADMEMIKKIGEGSFGEVMVANYRGTKVAVKRLHVLDMDDVSHAGMHNGQEAARGGSQAAFRQFFEREIAILASIRHPNVVNFIGACHKPGQRCLVTEYCARGSLDMVLHKSGLALDVQKRVEFALDIARGMACLHAQRPIIIHRDLKTANLLVSARFEVKVADFGLSRIKDATHLQVSRAGLEGTIEYCAPEVLRGEPFTERCDVYSFGVVLWELLLRQRPYSDHDVPVFLLMVNIGNGSLKLPDVPTEAATLGLCELVDRCLAFSAADRPDFQEVLQVLEAEYKGLRAQPKQQQRQRQAATPEQQTQQRQQAALGVARSDSSSSAVVQDQPAHLAGDSVNSITPAHHSPSNSIDGAYIAAAAGGAYCAEAADTPHQQYVHRDGYYYQQPQYLHQQLQPPVLQYQQPVQLQQRHRLSQADSLATSSGGSSVLHTAVAGIPYGAVQTQQQPQMLGYQHYLAAPSVPSSRAGSPRQQQQGGFRVLSAFGTSNLHGPQHHAAASGGGIGGSTSKPPRQKQHLNRARSMPIPQSMTWDVDHQDEGDDTDGTDAGGGVGMLVMEDSFGSEYSNMHGIRSAYSPCPPSGQLCMVLDPAASISSGVLPPLQGGQLYLAHPQQQLLLAQGSAMQAVPVVFAQPGVVQYQPFPQQQAPLQHQQQYCSDPRLLSQPTPQLTPPAMMQQQYIQQQFVQPQHVQQPYIMQQGSQPLQLSAHQQAPRIVLRSVYSPTPSSGVSTPALSSSPSMNSLNPLAVMAAAGAAAAAARREGGSGSASPAVNRSGSCTLGTLRRSSQGGPRAAGCDSCSPSCLSTARDPHWGEDSVGFGGETGGSTPVLGVGAAGGVAAPLLLQRLDNLHRSDSASPRGNVSGALHMAPAPALQSEHSGQLVGVLLTSAGSATYTGPPSAAELPFNSYVAPAGHYHRLAGSRLAIQGSYELPLTAVVSVSSVASGPEQQLQQQANNAGGSLQGPSLPPHLAPVGRRLSLLRIDSNSRDRSASPVAAMESSIQQQQQAGKTPFACAALQSDRSSSGGAGPSAAEGQSDLQPRVASTTASSRASSSVSRINSRPLPSSFAAASGASGGTTPTYCNSTSDFGGKPSPLIIAGSMVSSSSRLQSPFAAASICSPFATTSAQASPSEPQEPGAHGSFSGPDTEAGDDTTPRGDTTPGGAADERPWVTISPRHGGIATGVDKLKAGAGAVNGPILVEALSRAGKPAVSPFALLQQAATDDTVDGGQ